MAKYLVAWDGSNSAEKALQFTADMTCHLGGEIVIWRAVAEPDLPSLLTIYGVQIAGEIRERITAWLQEQRKRAEQAVQQKVDALKAEGLSADGEVWVGDLYEGLMDVAQRRQVDWIVLGRGEMPERMGSFALKILRSTYRPVAVIPETYTTHSLRTVVVPVDFSVRTSTALPMAMEIASHTKAAIHCLHVMEIYLYEGVPFVQEALEKTIQEALHRWTEAYMTSADIPIHKATRRAVNAPIGILRYVEEVNADLVIMDSHTRGPLMHLLLGSVTEKVLDRADVPVIVTKPRP